MGLKIFCCIWAILAIVCAGHESAFSQWEWRNPLPQGNSLTDIQALSTSFCTVVGERGTFLKTVSAGNAWHLVSLEGLPDLSYLQFFSETTGIVLGNSDSISQLLKTTDGGEHWSEIRPAAGTISSVMFVNQDTGWVATDSAFVFTGNGGLAWTSRVLPGSKVTRLFFLDGQIGWAISRDTVYATTDGGSSWRGAEPDSGRARARIMNKVLFVDSSVGWVIGTSSGPNHFSGHLYKSTDGGSHWSEQLTVGEDFFDYRTFSDIEMRNESLGWAVAEGNLYMTENGGKTWNEIAGVPYLYQISAVNDLVLWGCGPNGALYHSSNGGVTWSRRFEGTIIGLQDLYWLDEHAGFAAGDTLLLKTRDGGLSWEPIPVVVTGESHFEVHTIWFVDSLRGWLGVEHAGGLGALLLTTDGGYNWRAQLDTVYRISSLFFAGKMHGWASSGPTVYRTTDGGITWAPGGTSIDPGQIESLFFVSPDTGWAGGYLGLAQTTDGGLSWTTILPEGKTGLYVKGIFFVSPQKGWFVGYTGNDGYIYRTQDGGKTWENQSHPVAALYTWPYGITFTDANHGWTVGQSFGGGFVFRTVDGGTHWEVDDVPFNRPFLRARSEGNSVSLLGANGAILQQSLNSTFVPQLTDENELVHSYGLQQNYPNPFNPKTVVSSQLPVASDVKLVIYDVLGREVGVLVNERRAAGSYQDTFDGARLASGVYYYRLTARQTDGGQAGTFVQSRTMMLLK